MQTDATPLPSVDQPRDFRKCSYLKCDSSSRSLVPAEEQYYFCERHFPVTHAHGGDGTLSSGIRSMIHLLRTDGRCELPGLVVKSLGEPVLDKSGEVVHDGLTTQRTKYNRTLTCSVHLRDGRAYYKAADLEHVSQKVYEGTSCTEVWDSVPKDPSSVTGRGLSHDSGPVKFGFSGGNTDKFRANLLLTEALARRAREAFPQAESTRRATLSRPPASQREQSLDSQQTAAAAAALTSLTQTPAVQRRRQGGAETAVALSQQGQGRVSPSPAPVVATAAVSTTMAPPPSVRPTNTAVAPTAPPIHPPEPLPADNEYARLQARCTRAQEDQTSLLRELMSTIETLQQKCDLQQAELHELRSTVRNDVAQQMELQELRAALRKEVAEKEHLQQILHTISNISVQRKRARTSDDESNIAQQAQQ